MRKTRSDVVISVGANDGRNAAAAAAISHRPSLLDTSLDVDDENEVMEGQQEAEKSVAFGPDVVTDEDAAASGDPSAQPDCCDMMCPTNYIESVLCKADEALCVCDITDNFEAVTGIQLCADDEDDEDGEENEYDDDNDESAAVKGVDNSLVVVKADSPSNATCDETVSDAEASVHNASRSNSVLDESSGVDLQKDIGVLDEPAAAPADTLQEMIETDKKDEDVDAAAQEGNEEGSILSETLSAFSGMLRNPFPDDVSPIKKAKASKKAAPATTESVKTRTPETIIESPSTDNANDDKENDDKEEDTATAAKTTTTDEKDKEIKDHATPTSKATANSEDVVHHKIESDDNNNDKTKEEKDGPTGQDDADANAVAADKDEASPADTTDNTANITTEEEEGPEQSTNAANDNTDDILDITSDLQKIETDATSRRIQVLLRDAYGEQCFSPDELESKGQVLLERYAGREALLIAALEKKIRERREAMEAVENAHKAALGELEGAVTTAAGETSATATTAAVPAPTPAASVEGKKVKSRKSKLGKAKGLVKKFHKFSSPKKSAKAASC